MKTFNVNNIYVVNLDQVTYIDLNMMGGIKIYFAGGTELFLAKDDAAEIKSWLLGKSDRG